MPDEEAKRSLGDFIDFPINSGHPKSLKLPKLQHTTFSGTAGIGNRVHLSCAGVCSFTIELCFVLHPITITVTIKPCQIHQISQNNMEESPTALAAEAQNLSEEKKSGKVI